MQSQGRDEKNHFSFFFLFGENFECYQQFTHSEGSMEPKKNEVVCGKFEKDLEKKNPQLIPALSDGCRHKDLGTRVVPSRAQI